MIEKKLLIEAFFTSCWVRMLILCVPFKKLEKYFGTKTQYDTIQQVTSHKHILILIKKSIWRLKGKVPWRYRCYEQSLTAMFMLKKRKLPYVLYFGVNKDNKKLLAHVWIEGSNYPIVPKGENDYAILSIYYA